jgi:tRNA dimethylallyltransferase
MQIYRGMDIGTAKVPPDVRRVEHFGLDLLEPNEPWSAAEYQGYARKVIDRARAAGQKVVVCGGTGLYLRAALDVMEFPPGEQVGNKVRESWQAWLEAHDAKALHAELARRDPDSAALLHPHNTRRVIRALELEEEGESYAARAEHFRERESFYPTQWLALSCEREELYRRIDERVDTMIAEGLMTEVEELLSKGLHTALTASQAIGYKELVPVIEDGAPLETAIAAIKQATRRYAKRQLTWFRSDERLRWIATDGRTPPEVVAEISGILK